MSSRRTGGSRLLCARLLSRGSRWLFPRSLRRRTTCRIGPYRIIVCCRISSGTVYGSSSRSSSSVAVCAASGRAVYRSPIRVWSINGNGITFYSRLSCASDIGVLNFICSNCSSRSTAHISTAGSRNIGDTIIYICIVDNGSVADQRWGSVAHMIAIDVGGIQVSIRYKGPII